MTIRRVALLAILIIYLAPFADAKDETQATYTLIKNVTISDGVSEKTDRGSVLIENNLIKHVGSDVKAPSGAIIIDGGGDFSSPALSRATHTSM